MPNHIQRAYKLKLDGFTVIGSTGEGCLTVFEADGVTPVVDLCELSTTFSPLSSGDGGGDGGGGSRNSVVRDGNQNTARDALYG